jgi:N-acetylglucosamine-6-phosphate deacetylase
VSFVLQAPLVILEDAVLRPGYVTISGGVITACGEGRYRSGGLAPAGPAAAAAPVPMVEVDGMVAAGFVDVHVHGGDGAQVNGGSPAEIAHSLGRIARFHARHGTTSLLATTVSDTPARLASTVAGVASVIGGGDTWGARILGVHLEGPWIARAKLGAQDPAALRPPDAGELRALVQAGEGCVRMVTLAPELPGADLLIAESTGAGVVVALGHTDADFETARRAFDAGARHVTHLFNAMAPIHHRRPGAVTAALLDERVTLEVIADLEHVHPGVLQLAARLAPGRLVAVSDAVPAAGLEPGTYQLGRLEVDVSHGRVTLAADPATLAGSTLTLDRAISNLVSVAGLPLQAALAAGSAVPGRAIGSAGAGLLGTLAPGSPADLVVLDRPSGDPTSAPDSEIRLEVAATLVGGRAVWDPQGMFVHTGAEGDAPDGFDRADSGATRTTGPPGGGTTGWLPDGLERGQG